MIIFCCFLFPLQNIQIIDKLLTINPNILYTNFSNVPINGSDIIFIDLINGYKTIDTIICPPDTTICLNNPPFELIGGIPPGGTYFGTGVYSGIFYPDSAGLGIYNIYYTDTVGIIDTCQFWITVIDIPDSASLIIGIDTVCQGEIEVQYMTDIIQYASYYIWEYSGEGVTLSDTGNIISIDFSPSSTSGELTVTGVNDCGQGTASQPFFINVNPLPGIPGVIFGPDIVCCGDTSVIYSIDSIPYSLSYIWEYSGSGISIIDSGNIVYINFSLTATSGDLVVKGLNDCGEGSESEPLHIDVFQNPPMAGDITGPDEVCQGESNKVYVTPVLAGASTYFWNYSGEGVNIIGNGNSVKLNFSDTATSGELTVLGSNFCGEGEPSESFIITVNPLPDTPSDIVGPVSVSQGENDIIYTTSIIANALIYEWEYDGENVQVFGNDNSAFLNFGCNSTSGTLSVKGINDCGDGQESFIEIFVEKNPNPIISGKTEVCKNEYWVEYYTEKTENDYIWNVNNGIIQSGQYNNKIFVHWNNDLDSGQVVINETNITTGCENVDTLIVYNSGTSAPDPVNLILKNNDIATNILISPENSFQFYYWGYEGKQAQTQIYTCSDENYCNYGYIDTINFYYWVYVGNSESCLTKSYFNGPEISEVNYYTESKGIKIFPNPANDILNIYLANALPQIEVILYDNVGKIIKYYYFKNNSLNTVRQINISDLKGGFYILKLSLSENEMFISKLIKE